MSSVIINNITKTYDATKVQALQGISFNVNDGELFGLIGPDGAGKTTLFRILTTLIVPDSGTATLQFSSPLGEGPEGAYDVVKDYKAIRQRVGYMPGRFSLYQDLSVEENLEFFATVFNTTVEANYNLIKDIYIQIEPFKKRKAGKLSGGMKQKLALCCALIHKPDLLLLDEPTTGVDAVSRKEFWEMLKNLKNQGITIIVSTPYMDEASLCDRVALIQKGEILEVDPPRQIIHNYKKPLWAVRSDNMFRLLNDLRNYEQTDSCYAFGDTHHLTLKNDNMTADDIIHYLQKQNFHDIEVNKIEPNIEDCFMALMKD
ncbi:MAG: ABC transporter ATP-binding protein [Saprospiraceae bacterium]